MTSIPYFVFNRRGQLVGPLSIPGVEKSDAEWQGVLLPEQFAVARVHATRCSGLSAGSFCHRRVDRSPKPTRNVSVRREQEHPHARV